MERNLTNEELEFLRNNSAGIALGMTPLKAIETDQAVKVVFKAAKGTYVEVYRK